MNPTTENESSVVHVCRNQLWSCLLICSTTLYIWQTKSP